MFQDPGSKLKTVAKIHFWVVSVLCVILAFVLAIDKTSYHKAEFNFWVFIIFLIGGPFLAYINSLFLYGIGDLVENSGMFWALKNVKATKEASQSQGSIPKTPLNGEDSDQPTQDTVEIPEGHVQCPRCKRIQSADRTFCFECGFGGAPFGARPKA